MAMEKEQAEAYIRLLDLKPDNRKELSERQLLSICEQLKDVDLVNVKRLINDVLRAESQITKDWSLRIHAKKPINLDDLEAMKAETNRTADKIVRVYDNLDKVSKALQIIEAKNSPTKQIKADEPKRRLSLNGFKK
jgi:hypothetical protein